VDAVEIKHLAVPFVKTGYGAAGMIAAALLLAVSLFQPAARAADGSFQRVKSNGLVVCGTDGLLPYSSSDEKVPGFEVEIARALAAELGVQTKHQWVSWDGLIPALTSNRCDAIINGLFITDERKKVIDFSIPYYGSGETILVRKDNSSVKGLEDLKGKKTGVLAGSVTVAELERRGIGPLAVYPDQNTVIIELNNGRIDAAYLEAPSASWAIQKDPSLNIKVVTEYVPEERFNAGVGLRKDDAELKEEINKALRQLVSSGKIAAILGHYGVPFFPAK
jgi:ABC-type amino acid transport substrate-binding protein